MQSERLPVRYDVEVKFLPFFSLILYCGILKECWKLRQSRALIGELFMQMQEEVIKPQFLLLPKQEIESSTSSFAVSHFLDSPVFFTEAAIDATL